MLRVTMIVGAALLLLGCVPTETEYEMATLVLPEGNAHDGRDDFLALGCASCHAVAWESDFPAPVAAVEAPEFKEALIHMSTGGVATAILVPSHNVPATVRERTEGDLSPMGDFTDTMSVRQMIDIVAYLRGGGSETVARREVEDRVPLAP